ncbi:MAG: aspartate aminotransferase family protein [Bacteroidales bacterium]|nr:aspartate aminotransferase family protein [Bacteroidales bacterium]
MISNRQLFLRHVAQTSESSLQFEIERAEGIFFYDASGKPYIDLVSGVSVSALGHGNPAVVKAVKDQAERYMHTMVYGEFVQSPQVEYVEWLTEQLPRSLDNVYFVNSGSEAIDGAMKLAKRSTGRGDFFAFEKAYHGGTHGAMSILGDAKARSGYLPLLPGIKHIRFNCEQDLALLHKGVAGVIVEPIQAEAGIIEPSEGFLVNVRERCDEVGALMILDEIQTGMGRTGKLMAFEHFDVVPDILCLAKSFGGGVPLGAFVASKELMSKLTFDPPLGHITTFGGHPVSCAAGLAAQKVVEEERLMAHAVEMEQRYRAGLKHPLIRSIRGKGLFLAVVLDQGVDVNRFISKAFENGLVIDQFLFSDDSFRIAPPLIISDQQVDESIERVLATLDGLAIYEN